MKLKKGKHKDENGNTYEAKGGGKITFSGYKPKGIKKI